jgi:hypothetical protein
MARTPSTMRALGSQLPAFELPDVVTGRSVSYAILNGEANVVMFICNHCPFVIHLKEALAEFGQWCKSVNVPMLAISSNDVETHPADAPDLMAEDAKKFGYAFPYLYDETQSAARSFDAACTPDFFVFDRTGKLVYRGQFDASRPGNGVAVTGVDLRAAVEALLAGNTPHPDQRPSIGCNIKWKQAS